jgi:hypothetical protein
MLVPVSDTSRNGGIYKNLTNYSYMKLNDSV